MPAEKPPEIEYESKDGEKRGVRPTLYQADDFSNETVEGLQKVIREELGAHKLRYERDNPENFMKVTIENISKKEGGFWFGFLRNVAPDGKDVYVTSGDFPDLDSNNPVLYIRKEVAVKGPKGWIIDKSQVNQNSAAIPEVLFEAYKAIYTGETTAKECGIGNFKRGYMFSSEEMRWKDVKEKIVKLEELVRELENVDETSEKKKGLFSESEIFDKLIFSKGTSDGPKGFYMELEGKIDFDPETGLRAKGRLKQTLSENIMAIIPIEDHEVCIPKGVVRSPVNINVVSEEGKEELFGDIYLAGYMKMSLEKMSEIEPDYRDNGEIYLTGKLKIGKGEITVKIDVANSYNQVDSELVSYIGNKYPNVWEEIQAWSDEKFETPEVKTLQDTLKKLKEIDSRDEFVRILEENSSSNLPMVEKIRKFAEAGENVIPDREILLLRQERDPSEIRREDVPNKIDPDGTGVVHYTETWNTSYGDSDMGSMDEGSETRNWDVSYPAVGGICLVPIRCIKQPYSDLPPTFVYNLLLVRNDTSLDEKRRPRIVSSSRIGFTGWTPLRDREDKELLSFDEYNRYLHSDDYKKRILEHESSRVLIKSESISMTEDTIQRELTMEMIKLMAKWDYGWVGYVQDRLRDVTDGRYYK